MADLFISYAWTSDEHREWVRLLAASIKAIGYDVLIDANVDYGDSLTGFMHRVVESSHVLIVVDNNYVDRADNRPNSGVANENAWISSVYEERPASWLSVLFKDNAEHRLPEWLSTHNPKGHDFNVDVSAGFFPGSEQIEELWRWIEGLPTNRDHAVTVKTLREQMRRVETIDLQRDPSYWTNPALSGEVHFEYSKQVSGTYRMGYAAYEFALEVSECGAKNVYVYSDKIKAVGLAPSNVSSPAELAACLTPGRRVVAQEKDIVILMNNQGLLCQVEILKVQSENNGAEYIAPYIDFRYQILVEE